MKNSAIIFGSGALLIMCIVLVFGPSSSDAAPAEEQSSSSSPSSSLPSLPFADKAGKIQSGLTKILDGVRNGANGGGGGLPDLQHILRGSFDFTNDNTKRIADGVISAVFRDRNNAAVASSSTSGTSGAGSVSTSLSDKVK